MANKYAWSWGALTQFEFHMKAGAANIHASD